MFDSLQQKIVKVKVHTPSPSQEGNLELKILFYLLQQLPYFKKIFYVLFL